MIEKSDVSALMKAVSGVVRVFVTRAIDGLQGRVFALETKSLSEERVAELVHVKHLEWELDFQRRSEELIAKALAVVPAPKDGKDGRDGLSLKDFDAITEDGGRTWTLSLTADETVIKRTLVTAMPLDRGVYSAEQTYTKGDGVSWGGSFWIAQVDAPTGKPETSPAWRLVCKRGRDGGPLMMFVTLEQASAHLRRDTTDDDDDLILKIEAASAAIAEYLRSGGSPYEPQVDSTGYPVLDSNGDEVPELDSNGDPIVRRQVMLATLLLVGDFYANREPKASDPVDAQYGYGYLPRAVLALLYPLRMPIAL